MIKSEHQNTNLSEKLIGACLIGFSKDVEDRSVQNEMNEWPPVMSYPFNIVENGKAAPMNLVILMRK